MKLAAQIAALTLWMLMLCVGVYAYNDLKTLGLKGNVRSIELPIRRYIEEIPFFGVRSMTFDRNGAIATIDGKPVAESQQWTITRDAAGRISKVINSDGYSVYTTVVAYDAAGRIASCTTSLKDYNGGDVVYKFVYNSLGFVSRFVNQSTSSPQAYNFEYSGMDACFNWLKRTYMETDGSIVVEERVIKYWPVETVQIDDPKPENIIRNSPKQAKTQKDFWTSDLRMHDLKGHVKTVKWYDNESENDSRTLGFSQKGSWITINGKYLQKYFKGVRRDSKGRIVKTLDGQYDALNNMNYTYDSDGYVNYTHAEYGLDGYSKETFSYGYDNENRYCLKSSRLIENMGYDADDEPPVTFSYTILEYDSHGNWTRRKVVGSNDSRRIEKRIIYYW